MQQTARCILRLASSPCPASLQDRLFLYKGSYCAEHLTKQCEVAEAKFGDLTPDLCYITFASVSALSENPASALSWTAPAAAGIGLIIESPSQSYVKRPAAAVPARTTLGQLACPHVELYG